MILALKTADQTSELYLLGGHSGLDPESRQVAWIPDQVRDDIVKKTWQAGRELAKTLLSEIEQFLPNKDWKQLEGLIVYTGPGSFTGLRIGISTLNAIAYANQISIVGTTGKNWLKIGQKRLKNGENDKIVTPNYAAEPNITTAR